MLQYVLGAVSSRNPGNLVVAVVVVLGLETAEILATQMLAIHGLRGCMPASVSAPLPGVFNPPKNSIFPLLNLSVYP